MYGRRVFEILIAVTFYLLYEHNADNIKQAQAVAAEHYDRHGIEPKAILEKHE